MQTSGRTHDFQPAPLDAVLAEYLERIDAGEAVDRERFLAEHADLADELRAYWAASDSLGAMAGATGGARVSTPVGPPDAVPDPAALARRSVGDYELLAELGRGGMGVVWRARQKSVRRLVALKMIRAGRFASSAEVQRFRAEAEAIANLDHPNVLPVYEVGEHDGQPYFTMKLVEGGSLAQALSTQHPALSQKEAARLVADVARAIHYAHQRGILHRDLKPANILLVCGGVVSGEWSGSATTHHSPLTTHHSPLTTHHPYVTDFGLARRVEGGDGLTSTGEIVGTPSYLAPEVAAGDKGSGTTAADVYGVGAILYELLTGQPPFKAGTPVATLLLVRDQEPARPRDLNPTVPRDLETICLKCLAKEPARRYSSAGAAADDLERWLRGEPIQARPVGLAERAFKWARRRPAAAALVGVTVLAALGLLGGGVWFTLKLRDEKARALEAFAETCRAVDTFYDSVRLNWWLSREPGSEDARQELSKAALEHYRRVVDRQGDDAVSPLEVGRSYARIANLTRQLESPAAGLPAAQKALELLERLAHEQPADPKHWRALGAAHLVHCSLCQATGDKAGARAAALGAVELFERQVRDHPHEPDNACELADGLEQLAVLDLFEGKQVSAEALQVRALEANTKVAAAHPGVARYALYQAMRQETLGQMVEKGNRLAEAVDWYTRTIDALIALLQAQPHYKEARQALLRNYNHRARAYTKQERFGAAADDLQQVVNLGTEPFAHSWREPLGTRTARAVALARHGDHARAVAEADKLAAEKGVHSATLIEIARVYALASQAAARDEHGPSEERHARSEKHAARAVALLGQAHAAGGLSKPEQVAAALQAPEFAALATRADFAELRRRWERQPSASTP